MAELVYSKRLVFPGCFRVFAMTLHFEGNVSAYSESVSEGKGVKDLKRDC